jgi:hypothetical protein
LINSFHSIGKPVFCDSPTPEGGHIHSAESLKFFDDLPATDCPCLSKDHTTTSNKPGLQREHVSFGRRQRHRAAAATARGAAQGYKHIHMINLN